MNGGRAARQREPGGAGVRRPRGQPRVCSSPLRFCNFKNALERPRLLFASTASSFLLTYSQHRYASLFIQGTFSSEFAITLQL